MKEAIDNFVNILVKGDFLLVLFVVMIILIVIFMVYLAKLMLSGNYKEEEEDLSKNIESFLNNTDAEEPVLVEEPVHVEQIKADFKEEPAIHEEISSFENEQEEVAIISAEELDARIKQMEISGEMDEHEREIERYEAEQEDKAVISYDELIKRASTGVVNYESEKDLGGVRISKVDFDNAKTVTFDNRYAKEEAFLEALKEFRRAL